MGSVAGAVAGEREVILGALARVRRRLFLMRMTERGVMGLAWGCAAAVFFGGAWVLRERMAVVAGLMALGPAVLAGWAWWKMRKSEHAFAGAGKRTMGVAALLTAALGVGMVALIAAGAGLGGEAWCIPVVTAGIFTAAAVATTRRVGLRAAAIFMDRQVGLEEKVSTALEIVHDAPRSDLEAAFRGPVLAAAAGACRAVKGKDVRYQRMDRRMYAAAASAAIVAGMIATLAPLPALARPVRKAVTVQTSDQAKQLQEVLKEIEEKKLPEDKATAEGLKPIQTAIQNLQQGNMSPIEQSAVLSEAKEQLKKNQEELAASDKVEQMLKEMQGTQDFAKAGEELKDADMGEAKDGGEDAAAQAGAQKAMSEAAKALADKAGGMSAGDRKNLAEGLRNAAAQAGSDPALQQELNKAADAAEKGDAQGLKQNLQAAGNRMAQQGANRQMASGAMKQAMQQLDRMQGQGAGSESTMGGGSPGEGKQGGGQSGGDQQAQGNGGNNGGNNGAGQQGGSQGPQAGNGAGAAGAGDTAAAEARSGSTMLEQKGGPGDHSMGRPLGGRGTFVAVYGEKDTQTNGSQEKVGSRIDPLGGPANGSMEVMGPADDPNSTIKTYEDELPAARQRAMDELSRQEIPPQYRDMVKAFYDK